MPAAPVGDYPCLEVANQARAAVGGGVDERRSVEGGTVAEALGMSAVNASMGDREHDAVRRAQRAHEPSMEEILASIRTIIAEEREPAKVLESRSAPERPAAPAPGPQVVYSKTEPAAPARRPEPSAEAGAPKVVWRQPEPEADRAVDPPIDSSAEDDAPLVSPETDKAVASAFEALSANLAARSAELAEDLAREMLRPMLKAWLDDNLPAIVERLVRAEIERIVRAPR